MTVTARPPLDTLQRRELAEGVEVELRPAGPFIRAAAWLLDLLCMAGIMFCLVLAINMLVGIFGLGVAAGIWLILFFVAFWGYQVIFEAGRRSATLGKRAMGLRVVAESGGRASLGSIMLRNVSRVADGLPALSFAGQAGEALMIPVPCYLIGLLVCLFTRRFQRLGDIVAGTLVVYADSHLVPPVTGKAVLKDMKPHPPRVILTREERAAIIRFDERAPSWSAARREELAGHAAGLTQVGGTESVKELALMAAWMRDS